MSSAPGRVVVVGGGVVGASCAYYLSRSGWAATVADAGGFGMGCSHANCGFVCPSHVLPLAAPGAAWAGLKALFQPNGPLTIRPRFDPSLWSWLFHFARRCNRRDMLDAARAIQALLSSSRALYPQLIAEERIECEWETNGLLYVFASRPAMEHYADTDRLLRDSFRTPARRVDGEELTALEPALKPGLAGGWLYENDAHLRPDRLMAEWRRVLEGRGVTIREGCEVRSIVRSRGRALAVVSRRGEELTADAFVFATGALTPRLSGPLGCRIPIQPGKGYSITMARPARCPSRPLLFDEHRVAVTPLRSGYRLGSTMEFAGYDARLNRRRLELLREGARPYLHEPCGEPVEEEWFGWRPMVFDGKPIIDRSPEMANVLIAAGHGMLGLSMAPATGKLAAELLDGRPAHLDPAPYRVRRF
jgi:D-amino-acid dehydrogenase